MSLLCVFLVAQIFPTQAASHSQQLAEGRSPFKQKHFVEATRLQLDQIASIAGKTHNVISIYFLAQLAGLGINRLHFGAVHHCITWYCQAQCMPAAAFRKQIWWKELGHKFAMVALAWSYMHLLLTGLWSHVEFAITLNPDVKMIQTDIDLGSYNRRYCIYLDVISFQGPAISPFFYMGGDSTKMVCKELNGWRRVMSVSEYHSCRTLGRVFAKLCTDQTWLSYILLGSSMKDYELWL